MFPKVDSFKNFTLSPVKFRYLLNEAVGPHFRNLILNDVRNAYYSLMFDETGNSKTKKELQVSVRYWSPSLNRVVTHHLETFFLTYATGTILASHLEQALDHANHLPLSKLLTISRDNPNVNKTVMKLMESRVKEERGKGFIDVGECNLHLVHNSFCKGLEVLGLEVHELVIHTYYFFENWPTRYDDLEKIQKELGLPKQHFIKHALTRWLTLLPAAQRLWDQWEALVSYFTKFVPLKKPNLMSASHYKAILDLLRKKTTKVTLFFVLNSAPIFTTFSEIFQSENSKIHCLYDELKGICCTLITRACKPETLKKFDSFKVNVFSSENLLNLDDFLKNCPPSLRNLIDSLPSSDRTWFLNKALNHYVKEGTYLLGKLECKEKLLKYFRCLNPLNVTKFSSLSILSIAKSLPFEIDESLVIDEWNILKSKVTSEDQQLPIEKFWENVFFVKNCSGNSSFPNLGKIIKTALSLPHGNAEVERGFSVSKRVLTDEKSAMSERTLNSYLNVKSGLSKIFSNRVTAVPITSELISLAHGAFKKYKEYLAEQKREEEEKSRLEAEALKLEEEKQKKLQSMQKKKQDIEKLEDGLKKKKEEEKNLKLVAEKMFSEARERLSKAVKSGKMVEVALAESMIDSADKFLKKAKDAEERTKSVQNRLNKRKNSLIESSSTPSKISKH